MFGDMRFIEKLDRLIAEKSLTQAAVEKAAMLSENRISKWRGETGEPTLAQGLRLARLLEVPLEYLADDEIDEPPAVHLEPAVDEQFAHDYYCDLREAVGPSRALQELAHLTLKLSRESGQKVTSDGVFIKPGEDRKSVPKRRQP